MCLFLLSLQKNFKDYVLCNFTSFSDLELKCIMKAGELAKESKMQGNELYKSLVKTKVLKGRSWLKVKDIHKRSKKSSSQVDSRDVPEDFLEDFEKELKLFKSKNDEEEEEKKEENQEGESDSVRDKSQQFDSDEEKENREDKSTQEGGGIDPTFQTQPPGMFSQEIEGTSEESTPARSPAREVQVVEDSADQSKEIVNDNPSQQLLRVTEPQGDHSLSAKSKKHSKSGERSPRKRNKDSSPIKRKLFSVTENNQIEAPKKKSKIVEFVEKASKKYKVEIEVVFHALYVCSGDNVQARKFLRDPSSGLKNILSKAFLI